jgi:hypothetical protein
MGSRWREPRAYRVVTAAGCEPALFVSLPSAAAAAMRLARGRRWTPEVQRRLTSVEHANTWVVVPESEWMALVSRGVVEGEPG